MNKKELFDILLERGICITVFKDSNKNRIVYDLNTGTKSHVHLIDVDGYDFWIADTRYNAPAKVHDWTDLCLIVLNAMCGRDHISGKWKKVLIEENILEPQTEIRPVKNMVP